MSWLNGLFRRKENPKRGKNRFQIPSCNKQNPFKWYLKESPNCLYRRYHLVVVWVPEHRQLLLGWWGGGWGWFPRYMRRSPREVESGMSERHLYMLKELQEQGAETCLLSMYKSMIKEKWANSSSPSTLCSPLYVPQASLHERHLSEKLTCCSLFVIYAQVIWAF